MKKTKCLIALCLALSLIFTAMTGCRKVITYPDAVYSDIYSDIVITKDSSDSDDGSEDIEHNSSDDTVTNDFIIDEPYYDDIEDENVITDFGGIDIEGGKAFNVDDFGAKGDGKTDDGIAINKAINMAKAYTDANAGKRAEVRFGKDKTYSVKSKDYSVSPGACILTVYEAENITLVGENTTIQGVPDYGYLLVQRSSNIQVKGLNFTYDTPVAYTAKVIAASGGKAVFEVPEWYIDCIRKNKPADESFAIRADGLRNHAYFTSTDAVKIVDSTHCEIEFRSNRPNVDDYMYLPTPGYSHIGIAFQVLHNTGEVTFENINIWNAAQFVFQVNSNTGVINYSNVKLAPKNSNSSATVAWRDVIHAKDNRQKLTFDKCVFKGTHDDIFNLSNTMCQVTEIGEDNEIKIVGLDYEHGEYATIREGDTVVAIDPYAGTYYGEATITEVISQAAGNIRIRLNKDMEFDGGEFIYFKELACPGTTITNCQFEGTYRIKASTKIENCDFTVLSMWMAYSGQNSRVEGPIPENITFSNCRFKAPEALGKDTNVITFRCETIGGDPETEYHVKNIVFSNCTFDYANMIDRTNPYVTIK